MARASLIPDISIKNKSRAFNPDTDVYADQVIPACRRGPAAEFRMIATTVLVFLLTFVVLRQVQPTGIMLYQGIALGLCICVFQLFIERRQRTMVPSQPAKNALLSFLLIYTFVFTIPTTVDRAYSVKLLTRLGQSPAGLTHDEINKVFVDGFIAEGGGVDKRLREQTTTGSVREHDGRYVLTPVGRFLAASFHITRVVFACEEKR